MKGVSLTIPFYNEEEILPQTLEQVWRFLNSLGRPFELLLGDDGSTDASTQIAHAFIRSHPEHCRLFQNSENRGRGSILREAFRRAQMPIVAYVDADLEIDLVYVAKLIELLDTPDVYVCTGSKLTSPQPLARALHRKLASRVYNFLVRILLHSHVSDHQCGAKGFRKEMLDVLLPKTREQGWAFDTELLLLAQKEGLRVREFPVELNSRRKSTVPFLPTIAMYLIKLVQFRMRGLAL